jgi:hypothetical protein
MSTKVLEKFEEKNWKLEILWKLSLVTYRMKKIFFPDPE